jgi:hydroxymethylbilane synthase
MIRLATRGSPLALWQAEAARSALAKARPGEEVTLVTIKTTGDEVQDREISAIGVNVFTAEVDRAVSDGRADAGVHSLKDLGTQLASGLVLASVLERGQPEDALVAPRFGTIAALPRGATVGTGSLRRRAMLLAERPDVACASLRGNVDTRLAKVARGEVDAAIMARAGLERLGLGGAITEILPVARFLPAAGQGLVGITCRAGDARIESALLAIRSAPGFAAGIAERALLAALRAGCHAPVGAHAQVAGDAIVLRCRILSADGRAAIESEARGAVGEARRVGETLAASMFARGAETLLRPG